LTIGNSYTILQAAILDICVVGIVQEVETSHKILLGATVDEPNITTPDSIGLAISTAPRIAISGNTPITSSIVGKLSARLISDRCEAVATATEGFAVFPPRPHL
jgi:hypothetical protein